MDSSFYGNINYVKCVIESKAIDEEKILSAKKYIINNFDEDKNLNKYIELLKS